MIATTLDGGGLAFAGLAGLLVLRGGGRVSLGLGAWAGIAALIGARLGSPVGVLVAGLAGTGVGALAAGLDSARFAAVGLAISTSFASGVSRIPGLGGHMGILVDEPVLLSSGLALAAGLAVGLTPRLGLIRTWWDRLLLHRDAAPLASMLGASRARDRAVLGALEAGLAGIGGVLVGQAGGFVHPSGFGLGFTLDALTVALLADIGRPGRLRTGLQLVVAATVLTALDQLLADAAVIRLAVLGLLLVVIGRRGAGAEGSGR